MKTYDSEGAVDRVERILDKVTYGLTTGLVSLCAALLLVWIFVFGAYITARSVFQQGWLFVEELSVYWVILLSFFSFSYALRTGAHIKIDIVTGRLSNRVRSVLEVITGLLAWVIVCYMTWRGVQWFLYGWLHQVHSFTGSNLLLWPVYLLVPIGLALLSLELLLEFYRRVVRLVRGRKAEPEK